MNSPGYVWDRVNGMRDLNDLIPAGSGWLLRFALDINDAGQIVGYGVLNGQTRAYLLSPFPLDGPVPGIEARPYNTVVDVVWQPLDEPNVSGYDVFRAEKAAGPWTQLNPQPVDGLLLFRDTGLSNGTTDWYKVLARFADGTHSPDPNPVAATPATGMTTPVTDRTLRRNGTDVVLSWTPLTNEPTLLRIDVYRDTSVLHDADVDAGLHRYASVVEAATFTDTGAAANGSRFLCYDVRPVDETGLQATD